MATAPNFDAQLTAKTLTAAWLQHDWSGVSERPTINYYGQIDSTNRIAWEFPEHLNSQVVIACQQSAGRGQWGRTWDSPKGGLYLSLWLPTIPLPPLLLTLVSAWGIATHLHPYQLPVELKWPNDLLLEGKKLGGIKVEQHPPHSPVVIGVGLNAANPTPPGGISLQDCPHHTITSLAQLAAIVTHGVLAAIADYEKQDPHPKASGFLTAYWELLETKQRSVNVAGGQGKIVGMTPEGKLQVRLVSPGASALITCAPGDVDIGYPAIASEQPVNQQLL